MALVIRNLPNSPRLIQQEVFSDFLNSFDVDTVKKDLYRLTNEDAVKASIRNILLTNVGERLYSNVGSNIRSILFENFSPAMESVLADLIRTAIENYEKRARILDVLVNSSIDDHHISVTVVFSVINREEPLTFELILNRIR
jgi:phage baseplate assembly protein W